MRLVRFDENRLGVLEGDEICDVTPVLKHLVPQAWPAPSGDALIAALPDLRPQIEAMVKDAPRLARADVALLSPVARPSKIIAAPVNYMLHLEEARADAAINYGMPVKTIDELGLFLKANSSLVGASHGVVRPFPDRRVDHEIELALVIGAGGRDIPRAEALSHVAGYAIGLDMSVRGTEDRSWRKSMDSFTVLGPALVTPDEVADPDALGFELAVNGTVRQSSNTRLLVYDVAKLIAYASASYTLFPGDVILTGTPEGVGAVEAGDVMRCRMDGVGEMTVAVRAPGAAPSSLRPSFEAREPAG